MKKDSFRESIFNILRKLYNDGFYMKGRLEVSYNSGSDYL